MSQINYTNNLCKYHNNLFPYNSSKINNTNNLLKYHRNLIPCNRTYNHNPQTQQQIPLLIQVTHTRMTH